MDPLDLASPGLGSGNDSFHSELANDLAAIQTAVNALISGAQDGAYQPLRVEADGAVGGPAYTNPRPAYDLLMDNGGANTITAYDTGGSDSTSDLQAAVNAAVVNVNAGVPLQRIRLNSRAKYIVGGAVQTGSHGEQGQVIIPKPTNPGQAGTIEIIGGSHDGLRAPGILGYGLTPRTIIQSTLSSTPAFSATRGLSSVLGAGPASAGSANASNWNPMRLGLKGLTFRAATPRVCDVDAGHMSGLYFEDLCFDTDAVAGMDPTLSMLVAYYEMLASGTYAVPTSKQAIPIVMPLIDNVFGVNGKMLSVSNRRCGPVIGEYGDIDHVEVFGCDGPAIVADAANQPFRIGTLIDLDNAYGIGGWDPANGVIAPSSTPKFSGVTSASGTACKLDVATWMIQTAESAPQAPAELARVNDGLDSNDICEVNCLGASKTVGGSGAQVDSWSFVGAGASENGVLSRWRVQDRHMPVGFVVSIAPPGSGVAIRNPFARKGSLYFAGSITNFAVQGTAYGVAPPAYPSALPIGTQAVFSVTYTGTPSISFVAD